MSELKDLLIRQLALDYSCGEEALRDGRNHFVEYRPMEGRRMWHAEEACFLKALSFGGKLIMAGRADIIRVCGEVFSEASGDWFMDAGRMRQLESVIRPYGYRIGQAHPFYLPEESVPVPAYSFDTIRYDRAAIEQFRGDSRFDEAYAFDPVAPDEIGIAAVENSQFIGMAGASSDSPLFWQIGINVMPEARGRRIGSTLVRLLVDDVRAKGAVPFYGTSISNIGSQRVAHHAGFVPAWSELSTEKAE